MAYDLYLSERIKKHLKDAKTAFEEKKMFGGWCAMVDGKMCIGVVKNELMARVGPELQADCEKRPGARPMDFNGKPMNGYLFVSAEGIDMEKDLRFWIDQCLQYNPTATSSKKK